MRGLNERYLISLLVVAQFLCALFFGADVIADLREVGLRAFADIHYVIETLATITFLAAIFLEIRLLRTITRRSAYLEDRLAMVAGAFHDIIIQQFLDWKLTSSESDVAMLTIKGMTISQIAELRKSADGTVKAHLSSIYRKAGVNNRGAFLSLFIEELMGSKQAI